MYPLLLSHDLCDRPMAAHADDRGIRVHSHTKRALMHLRPLDLGEYFLNILFPPIEIFLNNPCDFRIIHREF